MAIRNAINAVVAAEVADPDEKSYFFNQLPTTKAGHPDVGQVEECFTDLLGSAINGPETYPPDGGVPSSTDGGAPWMCRTDMKVLHAPLFISGGTFDSFIMIAGSTLAAAGVQMCDINTIAALLTPTKGAIVTPALMDAGKESYEAGLALVGDAGGQ